MSINSAVMSSKRMDWETPDDLFAELHEEFGFTRDVFARADNAKCVRFFSPADDGLAKEWGSGEVCWMNPPYGREISKWMEKAHQEAFEFGNCVVCLVPSRTDTRWWHEYAMKGAIRFLRGRLRFKGAPDKAPFPSAVIVFEGRAGMSHSGATTRKRAGNRGNKTSRRTSSPQG